MKKIQEEIDRVVGDERAPVWEDEMNLPYLRASIKGETVFDHLTYCRTPSMATGQQVWHESRGY